MSLSYSLDGQVAIVTGAAGGIGRATAELLAKAGAQVAALDVNDDAGEELARTLGSVQYYQCDMANMRAITTVYEKVMRSHGRVDILVNNVGVWIPGGGILEMSEKDMDYMDAVNVLGPRHLTRLVMNGMKEKGVTGSVVFVASTQAHVIDGNATIYNVEKNTVLGMVKAFAIAGGPFDIRVNAVSPGAIATEGMGSLVIRERVDAGNRKTPLGRRGHAKEVAQEIVSLCFATYTTGDNRIVDGGFSRVAIPPDLTSPLVVRANDPDADLD